MSDKQPSTGFAYIGAGIMFLCILLGIGGCDYLTRVKGPIIVIEKRAKSSPE